MNRRNALATLSASPLAALAAVNGEAVDKENDCSKALQTIAKAMQRDPMYAWSWHCVFACASLDEGLDHKASNRAAERIMKLVFDVDSRRDLYPHFLSEMLSVQS